MTFADGVELFFNSEIFCIILESFIIIIFRIKCQTSFML